jgi:hypothetical protein
MNNCLKDFIKHVNGKIVENSPQKKYFQSYFSKSSIITKMYNEGIYDEDIYIFLEKISVKIDSIQNLPEQFKNRFFDNCLFEVNTPNIREYGRLHENKFSSIMKNEKLLNYITKDKNSFDKFLNIFIFKCSEFFNEDPKFLLLLLYNPEFNISLLDEFVQNISNDIIDYVDVFSLPKLYENYVDIKGMGDEIICKSLLEKKKLKKTWDNMIFSRKQLLGEENDALIEYVNQVAQNTSKIQKIDSRLKGDVYDFLFWLFTNNQIDDSVLKIFISVVKESFIIDRDNVLKSFNDKIKIETEYKKWNSLKCIQILKLFLGLSFDESTNYLQFICYLVKNNIENIVSTLIEERSELKEHSFGKKFLIKINNKYRYNCIFSSLLYSVVEYNENNDFFKQEEVESILEKTDLDLLDDVFDVWKKNLPEKLLKHDIEKILAYDSIIINKLIDAQIDKRKESLHFLNGLIEIVDKSWVKHVFDIMKRHGVFEFSNIEDEKNRVKLEKDYNVILDYIREESDLKRFKKLLEYFVSHVEYCQKLYLRDKKGLDIDPSTCAGYSEYVAKFVQEDGKLNPHEVNEWNLHTANSDKNQAIKGQWDSFGDKKIRMVVKNHYGDFASTKCFLDYGGWRNINNEWNEDKSTIDALVIRKNVNENREQQEWVEVKKSSIKSLGLFDGEEPNNSLEEFFDTYMNL